MGFDPLRARGSLRITLGRFNTEEEADRFLDVLPRSGRASAAHRHWPAADCNAMKGMRTWSLHSKPSSSRTELPGLDCGMCGLSHLRRVREQLDDTAGLIERCIHLSQDNAPLQTAPMRLRARRMPRRRVAPAAMHVPTGPVQSPPGPVPGSDSLGREFDFYLEHFPEEPGPREIILPHNPLITREMEISVGDILIGRPLGMSCGCPITHCGVATEVDRRTGVIVWCVTGPLGPRQKGFKDLGYYIAEGYEGLVTETRCELKIGMRYFFQPRVCMLQWRHSGLVNYLNRSADGLQVRLEGLWIG